MYRLKCSTCDSVRRVVFDGYGKDGRRGWGVREVKKKGGERKGGEWRIGKGEREGKGRKGSYDWEGRERK